jgi:hypothetical protein
MLRVERRLPAVNANVRLHRFFVDVVLIFVAVEEVPQRVVDPDQVRDVIVIELAVAPDDVVDCIVGVPVNTFLR